MTEMKRKVILLVNTGTPDNPDKRSVRWFLSEFLNDHRVIDLTWLLRKILVNLVIVPFRASKSSRLYTKIWTEKGSPLLVHLENLASKLRNKLGNEYTVYAAMRYGNPSLREAIIKIKNNLPDEIIVFPLYPQYSSSTTGSVYEFIMKEIQTWNIIPEMRFIGQFYSHPSFIDVYAKLINEYKPEKFDHVLFSYHGLPLTHIRRIHSELDYSDCDCHRSMPDHGNYCYKATCYETSRLMADKLKLNSGNYSTSFQSRLGKNWLTPFADKTLTELIQKDKKNVLVVAPSFVADCLETTIEINDTYKTNFKLHGGEELVLVENLNDNDAWVETIIKIANL